MVIVHLEVPWLILYNAHEAQFLVYFLLRHVTYCAAHRIYYLVCKVRCTCFGVFLGFVLSGSFSLRACVHWMYVYLHDEQASSPFLGKINFLLFSFQFDMHAAQTTRK